MPAFASLAGNDYGAHGATPVAHTLVPNLIDQNGVAHFVEAGATPLDDIKASVSRRITAENGKIKFSYRISWPITATETINGVSYPKVIRTAYAELNLTADAGSTVQERENIIQLLRNTTDSADTNTWTVWNSNLGIY
jgi:hypothetical protein